MAFVRPRLQIPIFQILFGISLAVGLLIPAFYDWTGSDQSRPSPLIWQSALAVLTLGCGFCICLPWLPIHCDLPSDDARTSQFRIRTVLVLTAATALLLISVQVFPVGFAGGCVLATAWLYALVISIRNRRLRWPVIALVACMYLPFAWSVSWDVSLDAGPTAPAILASMPSFFLTIVIGSMSGHHPEQLMWLSSVLAGVQLGSGVHVLALGSKWGVVYLVGTLIMSTFGSLTLNALVRM